jgi:uncharacterized protein YbjT (DUF2867 family)
MSRFLITGASGSLGKAIVEKLLETLSLVGITVIR